jgi:hypothetical protein
LLMETSLILLLLFWLLNTNTHCTHTCIHKLHKHNELCLCMRVGMRVCMYVCMYVCVYVFVCVLLVCFFCCNCWYCCCVYMVVDIVVI